MQEFEDHKLLAQYARDNSQEAYATLVARHLNLVYSVALRHTANPHQAEEITQAVFLILAKKAGSLSPNVILTGWLYRTARLTSANYLRMEKRRQSREQEAYMQSLAHESEPEVWTQIAPLLDTAMEHLSSTDRDAILLRFFEDKSLKEVGGALRTSETATQKRVERALTKLRNFFTKRGVTLSVVTLMGLLSAQTVHAAPIGLAETVTAAGLTKGAATSGSSLLLVKSTIKLMTWLKIKTVVVVGVAAILVAGTTTVTVVQIHQREAATADSAASTAAAQSFDTSSGQSAPASKAPPASSSPYPMGIVVPDKPGFVKSPYAEYAEPVDVRGYPSGTAVRCPYTNKIFIIPQMPNSAVVAPPAAVTASDPSPSQSKPSSKNPALDQALLDVTRDAHTDKVGKGDADKVASLLDQGADPNAQMDPGHSALIWALNFGKDDAAMLLLQHGADGSAEDSRGENAAWLAAKIYYCPGVLDLLIKKGVNITGLNKQGQSILVAMMHVHAAEAGKMNYLQDRPWTEDEMKNYEDREHRTVDLLVAAGADFNGKDGSETPLMAAVKNGHAEAVRALLKHGANTSFKDANGNTASSLAKDFHPELAPLLEETDNGSLNSAPTNSATPDKP